MTQTIAVSQSKKQKIVIINPNESESYCEPKGVELDYNVNAFKYLVYLDFDMINGRREFYNWFSLFDSLRKDYELAPIIYIHSKECESITTWKNELSRRLNYVTILIDPDNRFIQSNSINESTSVYSALVDGRNNILHSTEGSFRKITKSNLLEASKNNLELNLPYADSPMKCEKKFLGID